MIDVIGKVVLTTEENQNCDMEDYEVDIVS